MSTKVKLFKNGACVISDKNTISGFYTVILRKPSGDVHDRVSCDSYRNSREYARAFNAIAKTL